MVFLRLSNFNTNGLPEDGYGFDFRGTKEEEEEDEYSLKKTRLPDVTVTIPNKKGGTIQVTHRLMMSEYGECRGVRIVGGETYLGPDASGEVVGKIEGVLFQTGEMNESLQMAGDCLSQEIYEAMECLFDSRGEPKGTFKKKCQSDWGFSILYVGGVFVKKNQRGQGLGLEIVREMIRSMFLHEEGGGDLVLLCPAGEPNPGRAAWPIVFDRLASMFEEMKFEKCGGKNLRSGQSMYMFLKPGEHGEVMHPTPVPVKSEDSSSKPGAVPSGSDAKRVPEAVTSAPKRQKTS